MGLAIPNPLVTILGGGTYNSIWARTLWCTWLGFAVCVGPLWMFPGIPLIRNANQLCETAGKRGWLGDT